LIKTSRSRGEIAGELTAAIKTCLEASGRTLPPLRGDQCPLTAIAGFDSLCGIEVTVELQKHLGVRLDDNVFVEAGGSRVKARTFDQIVDVIVAVTK
jgi:acyl carrier protein